MGCLHKDEVAVESSRATIIRDGQLSVKESLDMRSCDALPVGTCTHFHTNHICNAIFLSEDYEFIYFKASYHLEIYSKPKEPFLSIFLRPPIQIGII